MWEILLKGDEAMELMCPVSRLEDIKLYTQIGVKEIYVGVDCSMYDMRIVSFTGRTKNLGDNNITVLNNFEELKKLVEVAHKNEMKVSFTCNVRIIPEKLKDNYIVYVNHAIECGVDSLIVGSIYGLVLLKSYVNIPIFASTFFYPFNKYFIDFINEFGVKRIILPTALTLNEIEEFVKYIEYKKYDIDVEVFCHFGCSNINGRCNMFYKPPSLCRGLYTVKSDKGDVIKNDINILDSGTDCTICSIRKLKEIGVKSLKIMGRGFPIQLTASLAKCYLETINGIEDKNFLERKNLVEKYSWWKEAYCNDGRCMYINKKSKYYV